LPDRDGSSRQAIIFELTPIAEFNEPPRFDDQILPVEGLSHEEKLTYLRSLALADAAESRSPIERRSASRKRSAAIREYILERRGHL
jgi:hypothetical protein